MSAYAAKCGWIPPKGLRTYRRNNEKHAPDFYLFIAGLANSARISGKLANQSDPMEKQKTG